MTIIELTTHINAPADKCFDLSRDVKIHEQSTVRTNERAVAGRTEGLFELNDTVTWEATHFGIKQRLSVKITKMDRPYYFEDVMTKGAFKTMRHEHFFENSNGETIMKDLFRYEVPFGLFGKFFDHLILRRYMIKFLKIRNQLIKAVAESFL
jgi:ligand-binding SRPBCC domain-containing protein